MNRPGWARVPGVDAHFRVEHSAAGLSLVYPARGGTKGTPSAINSDYAAGLEYLLTRLVIVGALLRSVHVDTAKTHAKLAVDLNALTDPRSLRRQIGRAAAAAGRPAGAKGSGNPTKRLRIDLNAQTSAAHLQHLLSKGTA